jgi:hypothetical protein
MYKKTKSKEDDPGSQGTRRRRPALVEQLIEHLRMQWWNDSLRDSAEFLRLSLTHPNPPDSVRAFHRSMWDAMSARCSNPERAERISCAAALLAEVGESHRSTSLLLYNHATWLDPTPSRRMKMIQLAYRQMGAPPPEIDVVVPVLHGATNKVRLLIESHVIELCQLALRGLVGSEQPWTTWGMAELNAVLFALRWHYVNADRSILGHSGKPSELQEDFRRLGKPLWDQLRAAAERRSALHPQERLLGDDAWHETAQGAILLSIVKAPESERERITDETDLALVVCRSPIIPSTDRYDREEIERHRLLEHPLPLARMPSPVKVERIRADLTDEFPWAGDVLEVIFGELLGRATLGLQVLAMPPTLLVGPAGSGKSRLARRIAEALGLPRLDLTLGGLSDSKLLAGTARGWGSGRPGDLATLMAMRRSASAFVILDELDKARDHHRAAGIQAYLLGLLEPETAARHTDIYLKTECDFTAVLWMATANHLSQIASTLLGRFRILVLRQPAREHYNVVAENVIVELARNWGLDRQALPHLSDLALQVEDFESVRQVRRALEAEIAVWARNVRRH